MSVAAGDIIRSSLRVYPSVHMSVRPSVTVPVTRTISTKIHINDHVLLGGGYYSKGLKCFRNK